jgi:hypothetical protein
MRFLDCIDSGQPALMRHVLQFYQAMYFSILERTADCILEVVLTVNTEVSATAFLILGRKHFDKRNQPRDYTTGRNVKARRGSWWESGWHLFKEGRRLGSRDGHAERCSISDPAIHCPVP